MLNLKWFFDQNLSKKRRIWKNPTTGCENSLNLRFLQFHWFILVANLGEEKYFPKQNFAGMKTLKVLAASTFIVVVFAFALHASFLKWSQTYEVGSVVDDFILKSIKGNYISLSDHKNSKGVILVFTSFRCPYSKNNDKKLQKLEDRYGPHGYAVIAIDPTISETDIFKSLRNKISKNNFSFPYLLDENQEMAEQFQVTKVPMAFILEKEKMGFVVRYSGAIDHFASNDLQEKKSYLDQAMERLLKNGELSVSTTKITGCRIEQ